MVPSSDSQKVIFDILFDVFQNTDFDKDIGYSIGWMNDKDVADRRQYREGYIRVLKEGVLEMDIDIYKKILLNNELHLNNELQLKKNIVYIHYVRNASPFYQAGAQRAFEQLHLLRDLIWDETRKISEKYLEEDRKIWLKNNGHVDVTLLKERISEAPYLQAIIFIQAQLKQLPTIEVVTPDVNIIPKPQNDDNNNSESL